LAALAVARVDVKRVAEVDRVAKGHREKESALLVMDLERCISWTARRTKSQASRHGIASSGTVGATLSLTSNVISCGDISDLVQCGLPPQELRSNDFDRP
jgi:hypothetical protein